MASAAVNNVSFTSPVANADYSASLDAVNGGVLSRVYNGMSGFNIFAALLLILIAYDQCEFLMREEHHSDPLRQIQVVFGLIRINSQVCVEQRQYCWAGMEDSLLRALSFFHLPEDG